MENLHLPMRWYIARMKLLEEKLSFLPEVKKGFHGNCQVVRIKVNGISKEIRVNSKKYNEYIDLIVLYESLYEELNVLKDEWKMYFSEQYSEMKRKYIINKNSESRYTFDFWNQLIDDECDYENTQTINYKGHKLRSRIELILAQASDELHLKYKYDSSLKSIESFHYVDFSYGFEEFNRCTFLELMGRMNDPIYISRNVEKLREYFMNRMYVNRDLFVVQSDSEYTPSIDVIKNLLIMMVENLCDVYMSEVL